MWWVEYRWHKSVAACHPWTVLGNTSNVLYLAMIQKAPWPDTRFSVRKLHRMVQLWHMHGPRTQAKSCKVELAPQGFADCHMNELNTSEYLLTPMCPMRSRSRAQATRVINYVLCLAAARASCLGFDFQVNVRICRIIRMFFESLDAACLRAVHAWWAVDIEVCWSICPLEELFTWEDERPTRD